MQINLTPQETQHVIAALDIAVKQVGMTAAQALLPIWVRLQEALHPPPASLAENAKD